LEFFICWRERSDFEFWSAVIRFQALNGFTEERRRLIARKMAEVLRLPLHRRQHESGL
jgi:hypothetical protein